MLTMTENDNEFEYEDLLGSRFLHFCDCCSDEPAEIQGSIEKGVGVAESRIDSDGRLFNEVGLSKCKLIFPQVEYRLR